MGLNAAPSQLTSEQARHFLIRTGFAPTQQEVDALTGQSAQAAVADALARAKTAKPAHPPPDFVSQPPPVPYVMLKTREEVIYRMGSRWREHTYLHAAG